MKKEKIEEKPFGKIRVEISLKALIELRLRRKTLKKHLKMVKSVCK